MDRALSLAREQKKFLYRSYRAYETGAHGLSLCCAGGGIQRPTRRAVAFELIDMRNPIEPEWRGLGVLEPLPCAGFGVRLGWGLDMGGTPPRKLRLEGSGRLPGCRSINWTRLHAALRGVRGDLRPVAAEVRS